MEYVITTVGTSAIEKYNDENKNNQISTEDFKKKLYSEFDTSPEDLNDKVERLYNFFSNKELTKDNLKSFSAEIKSLFKLEDLMQNPNNYFIYLISTDTAICRVCCEFLEKFLRDKMHLQNVIYKIDNLSVYDEKNFVSKGLKSLSKIILDILDKTPQNEYNQIIFNITGGFKALIPYLTIFAMLYKIPLYYIFEEENELIKIPPIPIEYDFSFINRNYDIFVKIEQNTFININDISDTLRTLRNSTDFETYFILENNEVTTSFIGDVIWEKYKKINQPNPPKCNNNNKDINLGNIQHHGKENLKNIAQRIIESEYVISVINSSNNEPNRRQQKVIPLKKEDTKRYIPQEEEGVCIVIDYKSDAGYSMLVKTTGRIFWETEFIAERLKELY